MVFASTVCLFLLVVDSCSFKKDDEIKDISCKAEAYPGPTHDLYRSPGQPTYRSIISSGNEELRNLEELPERRKLQIIHRASESKMLLNRKIFHIRSNKYWIVTYHKVLAWPEV